MRLFDASETTFTANGKGVISDAVSCVVFQVLNGEYELQMEYPVSGIRFSDITSRSIIMAKPDKISDEQPFRIYRITKPLNGIVTIYARHLAYDITGCNSNIGMSYLCILVYIEFCGRNGTLIFCKSFDSALPSREAVSTWNIFINAGRNSHNDTN